MSIRILYENQWYDLVKFLRMSIAADVKEQVWDEQNVSKQLFSNYERIITKYQVKILRKLERLEMWNILKRLASTKLYQQCLNAGLLYDMLANLKPETIRIMFTDVDVRFCNRSQVFRALKQLIMQQNVEAVKCLEEIFQSVLNEVVQSSVQQGYLKCDVSEAEVDNILRVDSDYILCVFIRYFRDSRNTAKTEWLQPIHTYVDSWGREQTRVGRLTSFTALCDDARFKYRYSPCSVGLETTLNCKSWSTVARA